ncbi:MAG: hypothetical protein Q9218_005062 [Villophora microphyllina]
MRTWFWLSLTLLHAVSRSVVGAIPATTPPAAGDLSLIQPSGLSVGPNVPNDFDVKATFGRTALDQWPSIAVCMEAMRELALHLYNDDLSPGAHKWQHPVYSNAMLWVEPAKGTDVVSARFALWTVFLLFQEMLLRNLWQFSRSRATYHGREVATVTLSPAKVPHAVSEGLAVNQHTAVDNDTTAAIQKPNSISFPVNNSSSQETGNANLTADKIDAHITYLPKAVDRRDILAAVSWLMVDSFPYNRDPLSFIQIIIKPPVAASVWSVWNLARPPPPEGMRMTRGDFISFLAKLPEHLYLQKKWVEMNILQSEDGIALVKGFFRTKP